MASGLNALSELSSEESVKESASSHFQIVGRLQFLLTGAQGLLFLLLINGSGASKTARETEGQLKVS